MEDGPIKISKEGDARTRRLEAWSAWIKPYGDIAGHLKSIAYIGFVPVLVIALILSGRGGDALDYIMNLGGRSSQIATVLPPSSSSATDSLTRNQPIRAESLSTPLTNSSGARADPAQRVSGPAEPPQKGLSITSLLQRLGSAQGNPRYDMLESAVSKTDPLAKISVSEVQALLGPARDIADRKRVLLKTLLPKLSTPISSMDAARMLSGFSDYDRYETLEKLQQCINRPISMDAQSTLLQGIEGAYRAAAARVLDAEASCSAGLQ